MWRGRKMSADRFAKEYAASIESFGAELKQTIERFQPASRWRARQEFETQAVLGAFVMIVVVSVDTGECSPDMCVAQILSALWAFPCAALLERAAVYYSLRDDEDHRKTGVRVVGAYLDAVGMPLPTRSAVPARYLATRLTCRILGDVYRIILC